MITPRIPGAIVSIAFVFLSGCHREHGVTLEGPVEIALDGEQKTLAVDAANHLREAFNDGLCQSIYEQATAGFRDQTLDDWVSQCEELRKSLGAWQIFNAPSAVRYKSSPNVVSVYGAAVFAKGSRELEIDWRLDNGRARLIRLSFQETEYHWKSIPPLRIRQQLRDSPMKPEGGAPSLFVARRHGELCGGPLRTCS